MTIQSLTFANIRSGPVGFEQARYVILLNNAYILPKSPDMVLRPGLADQRSTF
jgi:hypothetical protein